MIMLQNLHLLNVLLQVANTALAAVILDENIHGSRIEEHIRILQTRCFTGLGSKILLGDHGFLLRDIPANLDDLHTI
jgi:hypothetical protein